MSLDEICEMFTLLTDDGKNNDILTLRCTSTDHKISTVNPPDGHI